MSTFLQKFVKPELMHDFLKDKQAWEHAIALYQGPDPLEHWYNYVCWYENYGHGDPENKFRETLERCLSIFEHNDYYKQDMRMLRLWLKYIDMQPNALPFFQALYQRGLARQNALFYISWGAVYESLQAYKEAESVYNLGFQEKAQPYAELQHALVKIMYARAALQQQQQQHVQVQVQQQQQKVMQEQQVNYHGHLQHGHEQQAYQRAQLAYVQQQQQQQQQQQEHEQQYQQQQQQNAYQTVYMQQQQQQQQQHMLQQHQQQQHYHNSHTHTHPNMHIHQTTVENHYLHETQQAHYSINECIQQQQQQQTTFNESITPAEPIQEEKKVVEEEEEEVVASQKLNSPANNINIEIEGIRYPKRFVNCARNNHELWKPALCLEEAPDEHRRCHYAKDKVYPPEAGYEISPEELRALKYFKSLDVKETTTTTTAVVAAAAAVIEENKQEIHNRQSADYDSGSSSDKEEIYGFSEHEAEAAEESTDDNFDDEDYAPENAHNDDFEEYDNIDEEEGEEEDNDDDDDDDEDEEYEDESAKVVQNHYQHKLAKIKESDEQIESSTISLGQNKSIKIKFKKEVSSTDCNGANGNNYSAYKIESIYQQEIASPKPTTPTTTTANVSFEKRNGYNFHPYSLGQTSTPKTNNSFKRHKAKLKRAKQDTDNLSQNYVTNSNSSTAERDVAGQPAVSAHNDNAVQSANFNDNANYSFSSAVTFDNSNCSISSAVGRLNFKDTSALGLANTQLNSTNQSTLTVSKAATSALEISTFQENSYFATQYDANAKERRLNKALETIERHLAKEVIDPFNSELCRAFLTKLDFPQNAEEENYKIIQTPLPKIANTKVLNLAEGVNFNIDKEVGRGSYGSVYKATDVKTSATVALKYQKPPNTWEIYICDQVLKRITAENVLPGFMDISTAIIAPNASLIATEFTPFGSLLDINNKIRQNTTKVMHESLVMHFSAQICNIVHHLHQQKIIHADIKPDNFLLMRVPSTDLDSPTLRLIDFGCAIDMTLFPDTENTKFRKIIQTDGFTCIEMQEGRPWSYETDLFCVAATIHVMLFGEYMQPQKRAGSWDIKQKLPRYLKKHVWTHFFSDMLNINPAKLPSLEQMRDLFEEEASRMDSELQKQIRTLSNILYRR